MLLCGIAAFRMMQSRHSCTSSGWAILIVLRRLAKLPSYTSAAGKRALADLRSGGSEVFTCRYPHCAATARLSGKAREL